MGAQRDAAEDVDAVHVESARDQVKVEVREDGWFLALLRGPRRCQATVKVQSHDGTWRPISL
ncbi:MAG: hypothetical protein KY462_10130 [Actinobacteria bacterium]|nr:hypothetical protein [Actinomycetota bacterium]